MHRSFAKLLPWFYILGAQKNRLIEMVLHMFKLKTFKAYIPISFLRFQRYKLYSGTTSISGIRVNVYKILKALITTMVLYLGCSKELSH